MQLWGITDRGSVRKENQDTYTLCTIDEGTAFGVVCDGMGGARAGNVASKLAAETFAEALRAQLPPAEGADMPAILTELAGEEDFAVTLIGLCTDICVVSNALLLKAHFPEHTIRVEAACCAGVTPDSHRAALTTMGMCQIDVI